MNPAGNNTLCCCKCNNSFRTPSQLPSGSYTVHSSTSLAEVNMNGRSRSTFSPEPFSHVTSLTHSLKFSFKKKKHPKKNCCCSITSKCCCFAFILASCCWCPQQSPSTPTFFFHANLFHLNVSRQTASLCSRSNLQDKRNNNPPKKGFCLFLLLFCLQTIIWDRSACKLCHYHEFIMWIFYFVLSYADSVISKHKVVSSLLTFLHFFWWTIVYFFSSKD